MFVDLIKKLKTDRIKKNHAWICSLSKVNVVTGI